MSGILLNWANGLGLSRAASSIENDFANGYLFAEVLARHNQLDAFKAGGPFRDTARVQDAANNFAAISSTLVRLRIGVSPTQITEIIKGKAGSASKLLYDIYSKLALIEKVKVGRPTDEAPKPLVQAQVRCVVPSSSVVGLLERGGLSLPPPLASRVLLPLPSRRLASAAPNIQTGLRRNDGPYVYEDR